MTHTDGHAQTLPGTDFCAADAGTRREQTGLSATSPKTDLATYLPQVAAKAVAKAEGIDLDKVNEQYSDRVRYVASRTLDELREYAGRQGTITGFAYSAVALKFAWAYKRTESKQKIKLPDLTDPDLSDILNVLYTARQGTDLTMQAMTNCIEGLDIHPLAIPDTMIVELWQIWRPIKTALDNIAHKADLFEMALTRLGTDIDNLIDLIQKEA